MAPLSNLSETLSARRRERATVRALSRLGDRALADFGLAREDIPQAARLASRHEPNIPYDRLVRLLAERPGPARRDVGVLARLAAAYRSSLRPAAPLANEGILLWDRTAAASR